jgi:hypothetical protein
MLSFAFSLRAASGALKHELLPVRFFISLFHDLVLKQVKHDAAWAKQTGRRNSRDIATVPAR